MTDQLKFPNSEWYWKCEICGPVLVCEEHARQIVGMGAAIGVQVPLLPFVGEGDCINCMNEAKHKKKS